MQLNHATELPSDLACLEILDAGELAFAAKPQVRTRSRKDSPTAVYNHSLGGWRRSTREPSQGEPNCRTIDCRDRHFSVEGAGVTRQTDDLLIDRVDRGSRQNPAGDVAKPLFPAYLQHILPGGLIG